jgi:2-polyprenyl-6-methoxyphenol hydroxylase-like FAD-dependent oxidoreductase
LTATVIGGGIAGLASAASLLQAGWKVTVLERTPAFTEVGAGVAITRNGPTAGMELRRRGSADAFG